MLSTGTSAKLDQHQTSGHEESSSQERSPGVRNVKNKLLTTAILTGLYLPALAFPVYANPDSVASESPFDNRTDTSILMLAQADLEEDVDDALFLVTTTADEGTGSFRWALENALNTPGEHTVQFDDEGDTFIEPQVIRLQSALPRINKSVKIDGYLDGRLWRAAGITLSGEQRQQIFRIEEGGELDLRNLTLSEGQSRRGGAIRNEGTLLVSGVTFLHNQAGRGGAIYHKEGRLNIFNSTFSGNSARTGGAVASQAESRMINNTFSENSARKGGAIWNRGALEIANNILANSSESDCYSSKTIDPASTHNLIENNDGCGIALLSDDPRLDPLGYYNGPAQTYPLGGGSPAINLGSNDAATNEHGERFVWDQRGNGDPRYVAGYTDLGAFEHQAFPKLVVDTHLDNGLRGCTPAGPEDCPLRAAIELANESDDLNTITFHPRHFDDVHTIRIAEPLPPVTIDLIIDASELPEIQLLLPADSSEIETSDGINISLINIKLN